MKLPRPDFGPPTESAAEKPRETGVTPAAILARRYRAAHVSTRGAALP
jgi:hypothetical protein